MGWIDGWMELARNVLSYCKNRLIFYTIAYFTSVVEQIAQWVHREGSI